MVGVIVVAGMMVTEMTRMIDRIVGMERAVVMVMLMMLMVVIEVTEMMEVMTVMVGLSGWVCRQEMEVGGLFLLLFGVSAFACLVGSIA